VNKHARDLGLSDIEQKNWTKTIIKERKYVEVFVTWKYRGRWNAIIRFIQMISNYPTMILERRVAGLARRLLTHRQKQVAEFAKF
jgi:hypothetical protein